MDKTSFSKVFLLERYECPGKNSEEILNEIILTEFKAITSGAGSLCPQELIKQYNETIDWKLICSGKKKHFNKFKILIYTVLKMK